MILALALGIAAFLPLLGYDYLAAYRRRRFPLLFVTGSAMFAAATLWLVWLADPLTAAMVRPWLFYPFGVLALIAAGALVYVLFFALPFKATYGGAQEVQPCCRSGWYALCRHPGALLCYGVFLCLAAGIPAPETLLALLLFPTANLAYVAVQDRYIFVRTLEGYAQYQKETPFAVPTDASLRRALPSKKVMR